MKLNLPNKLSLLRIILIPVMMVLFMVNFPGHYFCAAGIFAIAALTDLLDGKIARKYNLITNLGKFLDPIADKLLSLITLTLLVAYGLIPNPWGVICLCLYLQRDLAVSMLREVGAAKGVIIAADKWGKYKTFVLDFALPIIMTFGALFELGVNEVAVAVVMWIGYGLLAISSVLNIISEFNYIGKNTKVFKD